MNGVTYAQHIQQHVRLAILQLLAQASGYAANALVLGFSLKELGYMVSGDQVRGEIAWLGEQRLVTTAQGVDAPVVATLTERGSDVSKGISQFPGVMRPTPGA